MIYGAVRTNKVGSECIFEVCEKEEFEKMTEEEQSQALVQAAWDSGVVE
jgi:hypothetical protein